VHCSCRKFLRLHLQIFTISQPRLNLRSLRNKQTTNFTHRSLNYSMSMNTPNMSSAQSAAEQNPPPEAPRVYRSLTVDMTNGPPLAVCSPDPIKINGALVWSPGPIHIMNMEVVNITVTEVLGPEFLRGWNKLPDELKVEVLAHNLTFETGLSRAAFRSIRDNKDGLELETRMLLDHCLMGPDIQALVNEVFYSKNRIYLQTKRHMYGMMELLYLPLGSLLEPDMTVYYPHITKRSFIRRVVLGVHAIEPGWKHVAKLAQVLPNPKHVTVWFHDPQDDMKRFPVDCEKFIKAVGEGTTFSCAGCIVLDSEGDVSGKETALGQFLRSKVRFNVDDHY
jgi:hypothetical protein